VLAALCAALGACASGKPAGTQQARTALRVENRSFFDMTVYLIRPTRVRLGLAPGNATTTLAVPPSLVGQGTAMRFLADPIGSGATPVSDEIVVSPGDEVTLMIPPT
jgi:hypothetical protein